MGNNEIAIRVSKLEAERTKHIIAMLRNRKISIDAIATIVGHSRSIIYHWTTGHCVPSRYAYKSLFDYAYKNLLPGELSSLESIEIQEQIPKPKRLEIPISDEQMARIIKYANSGLSIGAASRKLGYTCDTVLRRIVTTKCEPEIIKLYKKNGKTAQRQGFGRKLNDRNS